jgi:hypothetical protein
MGEVSAVEADAAENDTYTSWGRRLRMSPQIGLYILRKRDQYMNLQMGLIYIYIYLYILILIYLYLYIYLLELYLSLRRGRRERM